MSLPEKSILWHEYDRLSYLFEQYQLNMIKIPPVVVTIILGLTVFNEINTSLFGFGLPFSIFFILIWLGFCHAMIGYYGVQLIEIELKINSQLPDDSENKLTYYSNVVANGFGVIFGLAPYYTMVGVFLFVAFIVSAINAWGVMVEWHWSLHMMVLTIAVLILSIVAVLCTIYLVERNTLIRKNKFFEDYNIDRSM